MMQRCPDPRELQLLKLRRLYGLSRNRALLLAEHAYGEAR